MRRDLLVVVLGASVCGMSLAQAEVIHLKDGRRIEAKVTKRTETGVTIDWFGVPLTYWTDEIERVEESAQPIASPRVLSAPGEASVPSGPAARLSVEQRSLIDRVLERSGLKAQLEGLGRQSLERFDEGPRDDRGWVEFLEANRKQLAQISAEVYDRDALLRSMAETFAARFAEERLRQLEAWLSSPLARRMTQVEIAAQQASPEAIQMFLAQLEQNPPSPQRVALIERLIETTDATDAIIAVLTATVAGVARAFAGLCPLNTEDVEVEIRKARELSLTQHRQMFHESVLVSGFFAYQAVSDEELEQYAQFLESELGQWFNHLAVDGMTQAMGQASKRMAERMIPLLKAAKRQAALPADESP